MMQAYKTEDSSMQALAFARERWQMVAALTVLWSQGCAAAEWVAPRSMQGWLAVTILLACCAGLLLRRARLQRELAGMARRFALLESRPAWQTVDAGDALDRMATEVKRYREAVAALHARRQQELVGRVEAERGLQQLEERYGLAIRGVDDALWEWDLKSDRAYFSTRWKSMLGYADHELSD